MVDFTIVRIAPPSAGDPTYGVLLQGRQPFAVTLERPWLNNAQQLSCIPAGTYECAQVSSPKFGSTFEICDIVGRSQVLFHWGNFVDDSRGCVIVAEQFKDINGDGVMDVAMSKNTPNEGFQEFLVRTAHLKRFSLEIRSV